jgi:hypothetical protein
MTVSPAPVTSKTSRANVGRCCEPEWENSGHAFLSTCDQGVGTLEFLEQLASTA